MRQIDRNILTEKLSRWLTKTEIKALDARRAKIVRFFERPMLAALQRRGLLKP